MRVLGIDPGTFRMGIGVVQSYGSDLGLLYAGALSPGRASPLPQRLSYLYAEVGQLLDTWQPSVVAIEEPFVARNVKAAMAVGQAQAVAMIAAASRGLEAHCYAPREVKRAVTDYGGSSKEQVQEMVKVLLGLDELPQSLDVTDAIAVAICHINASQVERIAARQ